MEGIFPIKLHSTTLLFYHILSTCFSADVCLRVLCHPVAEFPGHSEFTGKRIHDPVVGILVFKEWSPEQRVLAVPAHAQRSSIHMLRNADELRRSADGVRFFG